jgi:hypothetical protein
VRSTPVPLSAPSLTWATPLYVGLEPPEKVTLTLTLGEGKLPEPRYGRRKGQTERADPTATRLGRDATSATRWAVEQGGAATRRAGRHAGRDDAPREASQRRRAGLATRRWRGAPCRLSWGEEPRQGPCPLMTAIARSFTERAAYSSLQYPK